MRSPGRLSTSRKVSRNVDNAPQGFSRTLVGRTGASGQGHRIGCSRFLGGFS